MIDEDAFKEEHFIKVSRSVMSNLIFRALLSGLSWEAAIGPLGMREQVKGIGDGTIEGYHRLPEQHNCPEEKRKAEKVVRRVKPKRKKRKGR